MGEPARRRASVPASLTVMTFNVGAGLAPPRLLVGTLRAVRADVVGLQELADDQAAAVDRDLADLYPHRMLHPGGFAGKGLLSRYPLAEGAQLHLFPSRPDLRATADVDGTRLTVLVAHPPPPRLNWRGFVFDPVAVAQMDALAAAARAAAPAVVLGDFNLPDRHALYNRLCAAGLVDAFRAAGAGRGSTLPLRPGHSSRHRLRLPRVPLPPVLRVDYIFHTRELGTEAAWLGPDGGSDHLPVLARLRLHGATR